MYASTGNVVFSGVAVHLFVNYELFIYVHAFNSPYYTYNECFYVYIHSQKVTQVNMNPNMVMSYINCLILFITPEKTIGSKCSLYLGELNH